MRYALLIALCELAENAKTKGFWIGIFMFPLIIAAAIGVTSLMARVEPSRHFVMVDQSGAFAAPIEQALERAHQRSVLQAVGRYVQQNRRAELRQDVDLSAIPASGSSAAGTSPPASRARTCAAACPPPSTCSAGSGPCRRTR